MKTITELESIIKKQEEELKTLIDALYYVERTVHNENIQDYFDMKIIVKAINKSK